jgi:hypothetical protein
VKETTENAKKNEDNDVHEDDKMDKKSASRKKLKEEVR